MVTPVVCGVFSHSAEAPGRTLTLIAGAPSERARRRGSSVEIRIGDGRLQGDSPGLWTGDGRHPAR